MIRLMDVLVNRYTDRRKLYLSWDVASWHISKQLFARIEAHKSAVVNGGGPLVETAPLPAGAQFLNVIESVFSGMARAIIHNSDYKSMDAAKAAIDRYFEDRNANFLQHPKKAGKKIWANEREPAAFPSGFAEPTGGIVGGLVEPVPTGGASGAPGENKVRRPSGSTAALVSIPLVSGATRGVSPTR